MQIADVEESMHRPQRSIIGPALILCSCLSCFADDPAKQDAKRLVDTGKREESQHHLSEARAAYLQACGLGHNSDAEKGLERVNKASAEQAKSLALQSGQLKPPDLGNTEELLTKAHEFDPGNDTITLQLAQVETARDNRAGSEILVARLVSTSRKPEDRERFEELHSVVVTGENPGVKAPADLQQIANLNKLLEFRNRRELDEEESDAASAASPCTLLSRMPTLETSPSANFDLALCAEEVQRIDEASVRWSAYLADSNHALDAVGVQDHLVLIGKLNASPEGHRKEMIGLYTSAWLAIRQHHYDRAQAAYQKALSIEPAFLESTRQLALLAEAEGRIDVATAHWRELEASSDSALKSEAQDASTRLAAEKQAFDQLIADAQATLGQLLERYTLYGADLAHPYVLSRLADADNDLHMAAQIFPLAPALHELRVFVKAQTNDFGGVRESIETLRSQDAAVYFYGVVYTQFPHDKKDLEHKNRMLAKIEIDQDTLRIAQLATFKGHHHTSEKSEMIAGQTAADHIASEESLDGQDFTGVTARFNTVKKVQTVNEFVYIELTAKEIKNKHLFVEPLHIAIDVPFQGPGARQYANNYTRLLVRYGGFDTAKLGAEHMTFGEKFAMVNNFINLGFAAYAMDPIGGLQSSRQIIKEIRAARAKAGRGISLQDMLNLTRFKLIPVETLGPAVAQIQIPQK
jgi:tetratricopeptide (TPR) repeat protein